MAQFNPLPADARPKRPRVAAHWMRRPATSRSAAGCGSKVAPAVLSGTLAAQANGTRPDILTGPGDDAALLDLGGVRQVLTTDHLRAFILDHGLMARITALHALGDIWAMGARPQAALVSITLPRMSETLQARTMAEIMAQAGDALREAGAEIVGGHSTWGRAEHRLHPDRAAGGPAITTGGARARATR